MAQLDPVNRLSCPEIAGHTTRSGIVSYASRQPGCVFWRGTALDGGRVARSRSLHADPADAIREAVDRLTVPDGSLRILPGGKR
ncbi:MAG TPA: hypothetical protein VNZ58_02495 [Thermomicrobiales bacterium]|nr:hypothetical protein [Thermomicrobiales bacterium]